MKFNPNIKRGILRLMNKGSRIVKHVCLVLCLFSSTSYALAYSSSTEDISDMPQQTRIVTGVVTDVEGLSVIGASIREKGSMTGAITDLDGKFELPVTDNAILQVSFIGYITQEIPVVGRSSFDITLEEDSQLLDEVVVVGYGVQKKITVTGSVATVKGEELRSSPTSNLTNAMVGRLPGVIGFQRADEPGGGGTTIRIRGTNSLGNNDPLIVIDGVAGRAGGMDRLNPNEIESISVLKDAAAAIYGSRAANGVILITTKRGKEGKPSVSYSGNFGFSQVTRMPEMANAFEYATMMNEYQTNSGLPATYTPESLELYKNGQDPWGHPDTNWAEETIKNVSPTYRHDVSVSGGSDRFKFYLNLAANGEDGAYKNSANRFDQYSIRANLDAKINDYIDLSYGTISRMEDRKYPTKSAGSIFGAISRGKPNQIAYWPSGEPGPDIEYGDNPVVSATPETGYDNRKDYYIQNTLQLNVKIPGVEGLSVMASATYDKLFKQRKRFHTPWTLYSWDGNPEKTLVPFTPAIAPTPELTEERTDETFWMLNAVVNYNRTFGKHTIGVTAGVESEKRTYTFLKGFRKFFLSDQIDDMNAGGKSEMSAEGNSWQESRLNYFGRVSYNYREKYLFEAVFRADGSYRFPKDKRYGLFPGVSAGWVVSSEDFWKENVKFINHFKLRASYSQTGNDALHDVDGNLDRSIQYLNSYGFGDNYLFGTTFQNTLYPLRTPNEGITWEKGTTYNVGLEFKFLDYRLSWDTDVFYHKRTDMLIYRNASLPESSGITLPRENLGEMANRGFESLIMWNDHAGDFEYSVSANVSYAKNKILYWDETPGIPEYQTTTGKSANSYMYYQADGVFNNQEELDSYPHWQGARTGDIKFVDINKDGKIDADDRVRSLKTGEPTFVAGLTLAASWKGFDIMALFQGAFGGETYIWIERTGSAGNYYKKDFENRWTPETPDVEAPRVWERETEYWGSNRNTYFLYDTDYLRLKNLEIGYTFRQSAIVKAGISNFRIFANATNLFTIDKVKVQDPEANVNNGASGENYPQRRYVNLGVTLTF